MLLNEEIEMLLKSLSDKYDEIRKEADKYFKRGLKCKTLEAQKRNFDKYEELRKKQSIALDEWLNAERKFR